MELVLNYSPYEQQQQFHDSDKKFRAFVGGLGSGKTMAGAIEAIKTMLAYPDCLGAILAPTYPLLRDSTIRTFRDLLPRDLEKNYNKSEQHLKLINGAEVIFRPCDDTASIDRLRNINLGWAWIDEASLVSEYAYRVVLGRLRDPKGPMNLWATTTPKGFNWIWEKWVNKPSDNHFMVTCSSRQNPYLPKEYVETLEAEYSGVFARQEIEGLFVGHEGLVYPGFARRTHVIDVNKLFETTGFKFKEYKVGVDFGFTNPSAVLKIGFDYDGRAYVTKELYQSKLTDSELAENVVKGFAMKPGEKEGDPPVIDHALPFTADSANPAGIEEFKRAGLNCTGVKKTVGEHETSYVMSGIKVISALLEPREDGKPRLFVDQSCVNTIMEFENYRYPEPKEENPIKEDPLKIHNHAMDALRYVLDSRVPEVIIDW